MSAALSLKVLASRELWSNRIAFLLRTDEGTMVELVFMNKPEGQLVEPSFRLDPTEAQILLDSLWDCGLRPSEGSGSAGVLAATQRHLEDMRKIAFFEIGITKGGDEV